MAALSNPADDILRELNASPLRELAPPGAISRHITASRKSAATQKSALILRLLRCKARGSRNKKAQPFYSIRAAAEHFGVPATTISRIYNQLKSEGLLTTVWGSRTYVEPTTIDNQLRTRGIVALPASLERFCTFCQYRNFFAEMRDALWKSGFATRLLFYDGTDAESPSFAELLLGYRPNIVIWFVPNARMKGTIARFLDRGVRVITVADCPGESRAHHYYVERERAIKSGLLSWRQDGIRSVTVLRDSQCGSLSIMAMLEKCLRDMAMRHAFASAECWQLPDTGLAYPQQAVRGIIFPSSGGALELVTRDPARFAKLSQQSRVLLLDGPIAIAGSDASNRSTDVIELDLRSIAKRIASDLIQSNRSRSAEPVIFQAKWVPPVIQHLVPHHLVQRRERAEAHRIGQSRIAV